MQGHDKNRKSPDLGISAPKVFDPNFRPDFTPIFDSWLRRRAPFFRAQVLQPGQNAGTKWTRKEITDFLDIKEVIHKTLF